MLKAIVFDFDGVIVDSEPLHYQAFLQVARQELGLEFSYQQYIDRYIGFDDRDAFREMFTVAGKDAWRDDLNRVTELCQRKGDAFEQIVSRGIEAFPGVLELIDHAWRKMPIAIASGATRLVIDRICARPGIAVRFTTFVTADLVKRSKPDPQTYALAVEHLAARRPEIVIRPEDCVAIEDTAAGIASARGAGLWPLGVTNSTDAANLHQAHRVVTTLAGLHTDQLAKWFG